MAKRRSFFCRVSSSLSMYIKWFLKNKAKSERKPICSSSEDHLCGMRFHLHVGPPENQIWRAHHWSFSWNRWTSQILRLATAGAALHLCLNGFSRLRQHRERLCCHETWTNKLLGLRYDDFTGKATNTDMENERCPILAMAQNFGMGRYYK